MPRKLKVCAAFFALNADSLTDALADQHAIDGLPVKIDAIIGVKFYSGFLD